MPAVENSLILDRFVNETPVFSPDRVGVGEKRSGRNIWFKISWLRESVSVEEGIRVLNRNFFSLSKKRDFEIGTRAEYNNNRVTIEATRTREWPAIAENFPNDSIQQHREHVTSWPYCLSSIDVPIYA